MKNKILLFLILGCSIITGRAQQEYSLSIKKASSEVILDGVLDEKAWLEAPLADKFYKSKPTDTTFAESRTEVKVTYNDQYLYIGAVMYDDLQGEYIVQSLKRDYSFPRSDAFGVFIDPYNDGTNGFSFSCNPYGAQREGSLEFGGRFGVTTAWDNKWYSKTVQYDNKWIVEMAIPFKTLRFKDGESEWHINFSRNDQKRNETSTWVPVPFNMNVANLAYTASMQWDQPIQKTGSNLSFIPYLRTGAAKSYHPENLPIDGESKVGFDLKYGITSSLNLDVTVNPDFSQVEVDRQQTNLDRFELFFPEKRQFFQENSGLFEGMGSDGIRPFYSRKVGLGRDTATGQLVETPITAGIRLSGKINNDWRVGVFDIQTRENASAGADAQNFGMAVIQRKLLKRSSASIFGINRQAFDNRLDGKQGFNPDDYNRIVGGQFKFRSADAKWRSDIGMQRSFSPGTDRSSLSYSELVEYNTNKLLVNVNHEFMGEDYDASVGLIRRPFGHRFEARVRPRWYPTNGVVNYHGLGASYVHFTNSDFDEFEHHLSVFYEFKLMNTSLLTVTALNDFVQLQRGFDPSGSGGLKLLEGSDYTFNSIDVSLQSDERKSLFATLSSRMGEFYNGEKISISPSLRYRILPKMNFTVEYDFNKVNLPDPYSNSTFHLLGLKSEVSFTTKWFWTTFFQYNTQSDNININSRLQWRFKPVSDFFLVYTDNYFPEALVPKSRAIILKLNYWFNL